VQHPNLRERILNRLLVSQIGMVAAQFGIVFIESDDAL
jgi:hypothetical protein